MGSRWSPGGNVGTGCTGGDMEGAVLPADAAVAGGEQDRGAEEAELHELVAEADVRCVADVFGPAPGR
jgi:hypothetical protein